MMLLSPDHWAQAVSFLDSNIIEGSLSKELLPTLIAIEHTFNNQKQLLFGLEKKDDFTVRLLYRIAKKTLENQVKKEEKTVDALLNVCSNAESQFKRILDAVADEDHPDYLQQGSSDHQPQEVLREI
ncbi:hypothetical protein BDC45DRAFT_574918 [Circinella umbellata]|nr:hypothetical protein BDC45DRAFT_574918 [Circinella umbellata]